MILKFSKLPYSREFSNIWFQKSTDIRGKRSLWTVFWKFQKPFIWVLVGGFNFRLGTYNVPPGSSAPSLTTSAKREFDGTDGRVGRMGRSWKVSFKILHTLWVYRLFDGTGWTGWTGWTGGTGYQKCPLNFFILCGYIDFVYFYFYTKWKLSPTFLWVSKFHVKLGVVVKNFKITAGRWFFFFWV